MQLTPSICIYLDFSTFSYDFVLCCLVMGAGECLKFISKQVLYTYLGIGFTVCARNYEN